MRLLKEENNRNFNALWDDHVTFAGGSPRRTGATLGDMQLRSHLLNAGTATRGA